MLITVLFFLVGIVGAQCFTTLPNSLWLGLILLTSAVLGCAKCWRLAAFGLGVFWAFSVATVRLDARLPERLAGQDIQIQGYVADLPEIDADHARFNFKLTNVEPEVPATVRLTWYHPQEALKAGQTWRLTVRLKPPHGTMNPGGFDYERWLFVQGIGATGYVRTEPRPVLLTSGATGGLMLLTWRQALADRIDQLMIDPANKGMLKALTIGDGSGLTTAQWDVFRCTGTTHLMVISGSHVALIAGLVYWLTLKLVGVCGLSRWSPQKVAAGLAIVSAFSYAGLTGFAVPAQRAALMLAVTLLALVQQRHLTTFHALGVALLTVLSIDPLVVLLPGFWLSFLAVSLIVYALSGRLNYHGYLWNLIKINWATSIGLSPLILYFFQQVSLITPLANLVAVPVIGLLLVPLALVATLVLLTLPSLGEFLFRYVDYGLQGLWRFLNQLSALPLSTATQAQPSVWALLLAIPAVLILLAPRGLPSRWLGLVLVLPMLVAENKQLAVGDVQLTLLDVGQGLSVVVQTASHVLVYDTGARFSPENDAGQSIVIPFLRNQDVAAIDTLVVSHGDNDHIGGADSLYRHYPIGRLFTSVPQWLTSHSPQFCRAGQSWQWDGVDFVMLSPGQDAFASENDNSCVMQIKGRNGSLLLTGDIELEAEQSLVRDYEQKLGSDVLIAPHHGSNTSSSPTFLEAVNPQLILIPSGYRNQFGHPHQRVLQAYDNLGLKALVSAETGAISVHLGKAPRVETWRDSAGHYWNYGH